LAFAGWDFVSGVEAGAVPGARAADEGEAVAQLEQEVHQVLDQRGLQFGLAVLVVEVQELQDERVLDGFLGGHVVARPGQRPLFQHGGLVPGENGAFVEHADARLDILVGGGKQVLGGHRFSVHFGPGSGRRFGEPGAVRRKRV
jgi:hypothetical protein